MANISHFTQTVNGASTTYDIRDANAVDLTSNQTVGGIKAFSNAPVVNSISLDGKTIDTDANGNMTYDSHIVDTIEEQGNGYIRYSNGLQVCFKRYVASANTDTPITLPKPFINADYNSSVTNYAGGGPVCAIASTNTITGTGFSIINTYNFDLYVDVICIGKWK